MTGAATPSGSDFESSEISPGASLHIRQESRRKTSRLRVSWIHNMGPDAAQKCLVPSCLLRGSRSFPSLREISRRSEELWGLGIGGSIDRAGQLLIVTINAEFAEDSRLPGGEAVLADAVEFIREVILQPHLVEGCFDEDTVSSEVSQHRRSIEGRFDDKRSWAMQRCIEETCHDEPWRFHEYGTIESLDQAFDANLHNAVQEVENAAVPSGTVVQVLQEGYLLHDRLLRPAMVVVSRGGPKRESPSPGTASSDDKSGVDTSA